MATPQKDPSPSPLTPSSLLPPKEKRLKLDRPLAPKDSTSELTMGTPHYSLDAFQPSPDQSADSAKVSPRGSISIAMEYVASSQDGLFRYLWSRPLLIPGLTYLIVQTFGKILHISHIIAFVDMGGYRFGQLEYGSLGPSLQTKQSWPLYAP